MEVLETGEIRSRNDEGQRLIDELALDGRKITRMRSQIIRTIRSLQENDWKLFLLWMGFPEDLPDLANVKPQPESNTRPTGIAESWLRRKPLPQYYE